MAGGVSVVGWSMVTPSPCPPWTPECDLWIECGSWIPRGVSLQEGRHRATEGGGRKDRGRCGGGRPGAWGPQGLDEAGGTLPWSLWRERSPGTPDLGLPAPEVGENERLSFKPPDL